MSTSLNDEELELLDDFHDDRSSHDSEQEQGLLKQQHRDQEDWSDDDVDIAQPTSRPQWKTFAMAGAVLALFLILAGLIVAVAHRAESVAEEAVQQIMGVQRPNYVLDSSWDHSARPRRREYEFVIRDHDHNPDGIYRPMMLVNNQFPGPLIEANEGDTIVVRVDNRAVNATAIHWHGIYQNGTPQMDGTVGISQCPIAPGQSFTYEFTVAGQSGTYWWHAHQGLQSSDGVHGPLIIHSRNERSVQRLAYDTDRVILLSDHYHDLSSALLWQYLKPDMENAEPTPQNALINGQNIRECSEFPDRRCDASNAGLAEFFLKRKMQHRLRLINVGAFAEFQFQVDEHKLFVSEVDGTDVSPVEYHRININPAQRYSVILKTDQGRRGEAFWMRARMVSKCFTDPPKTLQSEVRGIIRYFDNIAGPNSRDWEERLDTECHDLNTTDLVPVQKIAAPSTPDAFFYIRSNFEIGAYRLSRGFFNTSSWRPDVHSPSLSRLISGLDSGNVSFAAPPSGNEHVWINDAAFNADRQFTIQTRGVQTIDILFSNFDDGNHPLHLHGYKYFVLAQGHGHPPLTRIDAAINVVSLTPLYETIDLSNPLRRDTASVEAFGWILIRIVADNPGAWLLHCHVSWHSEAGLAMQLLTRTDELDAPLVTEEHAALCSANGIERGTGPNDKDYESMAR